MKLGLSLLSFLASPLLGAYIYNVKLKSDETLEMNKTRLAAKDYTKKKGFEYKETFSSVEHFRIVRLFLALATIYKWHLYKLDAHNAFFHEDLDEEIYMDLSLEY